MSHVDGVLPVGESLQPGTRSDIVRIFSWGASGVSLFFVLSGFVIAWSWSPGVSASTFLMRRAARIWPAHAVVWLAFVVAGAAGIVPVSRWPGALASLFLVHTWVPGSGWANAVNPVAWTLGCEAFFYLTFPLYIGRLAALSTRGLVTVALSAGALSSIVMITILEPRGVTVSTFPPVRALEFLLGVIAGLVLRRGAAPRLAPPPVLVLAAVGANALQWWIPALRGVALASMPWIFLALVVRLAADDVGRRPSRFLAARVTTWAGELSFAFYLCQLLSLALVRHVVTPTTWLASSLVLSAWLGANLVLAVALHERVERPGVRLARRRA